MLRVYGINTCDTCRKAQKHLEARDVPFTYHDLRKDGLPRETLEAWADLVDWNVLLNRRSQTWRALSEEDRADLDRQRALDLIAQHTTLLKRPVFEHPQFIEVGFRPQSLDALIRRHLEVA